jgi:hypothetical protein
MFNSLKTQKAVFFKKSGYQRRTLFASSAPPF